MLTVNLLRHKKMILTSIFFFYLGCGITLNFSRMDCVNAANSLKNNGDTGPSLLDKVEYAVLILSGPNNGQKRDAIRATWAKFSSNIVIENGEKLFRWNHTWIGQHSTPEIVKMFFIIGTQHLDKTKMTKLDIENNRNNDLLLLDTFQDSYKNLTIKLLHSLKWLNDNLRSLKYLIKCDDDSFVRTDLIIRDIEAYAPQMNAPEIANYVSHKENHLPYSGLYWGYFHGKAQVFLKGKYEERDWFLSDKYLPYALGGGYVISHSIIEYIARNFDILSHYNSEDVTMGLWTAALKGINRVHDTRFDTEYKSRGCQNNMLVRHKQTPKDMFEMYKTLAHSHGQILCTTSTVEKEAYMYNWNVLPSKCCS